MATPTKKQLQDLYNQTKNLVSSAQGTQYAPEVISLQKNVNDYISQYVPRKVATGTTTITPQTTTQTPETTTIPQDPITKFNTALYDMLKQYQTGNNDITTKLYEQQQGLQTEQNARGMAYNPELSQLSPSQQSAIRQGTMSALEPQIQNTNAQIKASDARMANFTSMIQQAREFGKDYAEQIVPDKTTIQSYKDALLGGADITDVLGKVNDATRKAVFNSMTSDDWDKISEAKAASSTSNLYKWSGGVFDMTSKEWIEPPKSWITNPTTGIRGLSSGGTGGVSGKTYSTNANNGNGGIVVDYKSNNITPTTSINKLSIDKAFNMAKGAAAVGQAQRYQREYENYFNPFDAAGLKDYILRKAYETEDADSEKRIGGAYDTLAALKEIESLIQEARNSGADTGILTGTVEDVMRNLGATMNPKLVNIQTRINTALINYRRAATGVQFSLPEAKQYEKQFPNIRNNFDVNQALINTLKNDFQSQLDSFYTRKLGRDGYTIVMSLDSFNQSYPSNQSNQQSNQQGQRKPLSNFEQ